MKKKTAVIIGYGGRGSIYAKYAINFPEKFEIVAVADTIENRLETAKELHNLRDDQLFSDYKDLAKLSKMADIAIIATSDTMHLEPALAMIEKGYHLLLEKPMGFNPKECKLITEAAEKKGVEVIICHVLRYTKHFERLKQVIDDGAIGKIVSIFHSEDVGQPNYIHSFLRGIWRNTEMACPMIIAKCCHDFDIIQWLIGKKAKKVQSFGSKTHFIPENMPKGAPEFCYQGCPVGDTCRYNATKFYFRHDEPGYDIWRCAATDTVAQPTSEEVMDALKVTNYGRCVYNCGSTVVDHQIVNLEYEDGITVTINMNPFNRGDRYTRIYGTDGFIEASFNDATIRIFSFDTNSWTDAGVENIDDGTGSGHGGGDFGIMDTLLCAVDGDKSSPAYNSVRISYLNHIQAFAAEEARLSGKVIDIEEFENNI